MITVVGDTSDVFVAAEVRYHKNCSKNYTRTVDLLCDDDQNSHIHNVEILEVNQMFLKHVQKVILELKACARYLLLFHQMIALQKL